MPFAERRLSGAAFRKRPFRKERPNPTFSAEFLDCADERPQSGRMDYDFSTLSHADFEDLTRDLLGRKLAVRFEAFPEGPDDGMDGRHASAEGAIILQAKHYHRSGFSALKSKMKKERPSIDALQAKRYILATSTPLTPKNKSVLAEIIGPSLLTHGDIFGPDDLNALLRKYPDIETSHAKLWGRSTAVLKAVVTAAMAEALPKRTPVPPVLACLLPQVAETRNNAAETEARDVIFLVKSSPGDDEFALWLAPKLEAEGYHVFADILTLQPGDRWRREINRALEHRAVKVLLLCRNATLADQAVQDCGFRRRRPPIPIASRPPFQLMAATVPISWGQAGIVSKVGFRHVIGWRSGSSVRALLASMLLETSRSEPAMAV